MRRRGIDGNATAFGLHQQLFHHQHAPVVIDDVDKLYSDRASIRLLKSLCQTDPVKRVGCIRPKPAATESPPVSKPQAAIANEWKLNGNVAAVEDRGHVIVFEPTPS